GLAVARSSPTSGSRLSKRRAEPKSSDSGPFNSQPKLALGLSSHACTSATMPGDELQTLTPCVRAIDALPAATAAKSPPGVVQLSESKIRYDQVTSAGSAGEPVPPMANDAPSPQSASTRWIATVISSVLGPAA